MLFTRMLQISHDYSKRVGQKQKADEERGNSLVLFPLKIEDSSAIDSARGEAADPLQIWFLVMSCETKHLHPCTESGPSSTYLLC